MDRAHWTDGSSQYELDLDRAIELARRKGARRIGIQVPEGLKRAAHAISRQIQEATGAEVLISGDPCYGACDLDLALCGEVDLMIHLGHAELGDQASGHPSNAIFLEARMGSDLAEAAENAVPLLRSRRVGLATTVQHVHKLGRAVDVLKRHGIEALIGPACSRAKYPGQVLGCSYCTASALDVDEYLFLGTGKFHPLGIALATGKRVIATDPVTGLAEEIDTSPILKRRFGAISRAFDAKRIAVLVSKKPGQRRFELARKMMEMGLAAGKEMSLIYLDNIEPDRLVNLGLDAAVSTACPRIALDDAAKYKIPVLTPPEFEVLLGKRDWEDYAFDEIGEAY
ncbi:MAG TPA: diphthamide biosynthesis enzyme Dph2 [Methanotrichaceae archaeon]|nr:diphthamide biosynthesis enzyme Dph2 [Methanotrichaceae archaeon]